MSKAVLRMTGLAIMVLSVFAILFGIHLPQAGAIADSAGIALSLAGVVALFAGLVMYAVAKKNE